ncbi:LPXTG cell wall anchor domain-containing protein [Streptomyces sp. NBC_00299]
MNGPRPSGTTKPAPKPAPPRAHQPRPAPPAPVPQGEPEGALAQTGADQALAAAAAGGTLLVVGGAVLYRRFRPQAVS